MIPCKQGGLTMAEGYTDRDVLVSRAQFESICRENVWLRGWARDFLVAEARRTGVAALDNFRRRQLEVLAAEPIDYKATGIPRDAAERGEAAFTTLLFETTKRLIEAVVDEARRKFAAGSPDK
jgi:hypothetical protein